MKEARSASEIIRTRPGGEFEIRLRCHLAMGYVWTFEFDEGIALIDSKDTPEGIAADLPGGTDEIHVFQALSSGSHRLRATLSQPWNGIAADTRCYAILAEDD